MVLKIHGALKAVGLALLVLFFVAGVVKTMGSLAELKRPEQAVRLFVRFGIAQGVVVYGLDLMLAIFRIIQGVISTTIGAAGFNTLAPMQIPGEMVTAIQDISFLESIGPWAISLIGSLIMVIFSFVMIMTVYGRFFKLYMYTAISPVALSTFAGEPSSNIGKSFLKSYAGVCLEGVVIVIGCILFSVMVAAPPAAKPDATSVALVYNYIIEIIFNFLLLTGFIRMSDRIVKEMLGI